MYRITLAKTVATVAMTLGLAVSAMADTEEVDTLELETMTVTAAPQEEQNTIGLNAGLNAADIERRGASHMSDLIDQISGTSVNNLYSRPEISVGVQGISGHGRVTQTLEGIKQNFTAFTRDIGQTGSIFVQSQFLKNIDVTRGGGAGTAGMGGLGSSVNFSYLDLEDILRPGKKIGGLIRGATGISKYANGREPTGSVFLGGRTDHWDVMVGAARSKNDPYRIGNNFSTSDMKRDAYANNLDFAVLGPTGGGTLDPYAGQKTMYSLAGLGGLGAAAGSRQFTDNQLKWLEQAADAPLLGTQKEEDAQMLRLRYYFNDANDQRLELFATANSAEYETDQQPTIWVNEDGSSRWHDYPWSVKAELDNTVVSLKYGGNFSDWLNPQAQIFYEQQERKQRWTGTSDGSAKDQPLHYFVDIGSTGLKIDNAGHFHTALTGPLRLDVGLELRHSDKKVDSLTEDEYFVQEQQAQGRDLHALKWDPDSRTDTAGLALSLSTEGDGPWQSSVGAGCQRVWMTVEDPYFEAGNIKPGGGTLYAAGYYLPQFLAQGYPFSQALQMASEAATQSSHSVLIDPDAGGTRVAEPGDQKYRWDLKSAHFDTHYTLADTGLTPYVRVGYSERAPTSGEMYINGAWLKTYFSPNPDLEPEENLAFQAGVNYQRESWLSGNDRLDIGVNYYRNRIRNYITYGPIRQLDGDDAAPFEMGAHAAHMNDLEDFIRHGVELNLNYHHPLFYVRANLTLPIRRDNKICSWESPSGRNFHKVANPDGSITYTPYEGKGERVCYSSWDWMQTGEIEPVRGSLTAALTPLEGNLEVGGTLHYRGKQRAVFWYDPDLAGNNSAEENSAADLPDHSDFVDISLWPKVIKVDLFVNYHINDRLKAGLYLANLTDQMEATTTTFGYNFYPGRTLTASLEYRF